MKNILFNILLILMILNSFYCSKKNNAEDNTSISVKPDIENITLLNKIIDDSKTIDIETFIAISILYSISIKEYIEEQTITETQSDFFSKRRTLFFNSIKYSEAEYDFFMINNQTIIESYLANHPDIMRYFTFLK